MKAQRAGLTFSHVGFFVTDIEKQADFYKNVLDFTQTDRGQLPGPIELLFLSRDPDEHHQIVLVGGRPEHLQFNVINQISLKADSLATLKQYHARLLAAGVADVKPVTHGNALSVYCRDPEGNRVELYIDTPWYVDQPCRIDLPIELDEEALMAWSEKHARTLPGFRPRAEWRQEMARRMGIAQQ